MVATFLLVGAPGLQGKTAKAGGYTIGGEAWRVPLEAALLIALVFVTFAKKPDIHKPTRRH